MEGEPVVSRKGVLQAPPREKVVAENTKQECDPT
jgi:hypothetical protein